MSFQEAINVYGVDAITFLQGRFQSWVPFFMTVTKIGDPSLAFTFYFPAVCALSIPLGLTLLWTLIFCEWGNMILKWVLAGDRPYWWVHESPYYLHKRLPYIMQFPVTCETGPGMPSGHSTLNAALFFILARAASSYLEPRIARTIGVNIGRRIRQLIWLLYGVWLILVMTSRTIIGAHFPHQCLVGVIIGIFTSLFVSWKKPFREMTHKKALTLTAILLSSVGIVFGLYKALGNNPMWSINKAIRWCASREFIHIDSSPFYALSRYAGQALGLGLALSSSYYGKLDLPRFTLKMKISQMILSLAVGQGGDFVHRALPSTMTGYYVLEFILNVSLPYILVCLLPWFIMKASKVKQKPKLKKH